LMGGIVWAADHYWITSLTAHWPPFFHLAVLVAIGGVSYAGLLWFTARESVREIIALASKRSAPADSPAASAQAAI
jgi:hypothetical protein